MQKEKVFFRDSTGKYVLVLRTHAPMNRASTGIWYTLEIAGADKPLEAGELSDLLGKVARVDMCAALWLWSLPICHDYVQACQMAKAAIDNGMFPRASFQPIGEGNAHVVIALGEEGGQDTIKAFQRHGWRHDKQPSEGVATLYFDEACSCWPSPQDVAEIPWSGKGPADFKCGTRCTDGSEHNIVPTAEPGVMRCAKCGCTLADKPTDTDPSHTPATHIPDKLGLTPPRGTP